MKNMGGQSRLGVAAFDKETGIFCDWFESAHEAARQMDVFSTSICKCCKGVYKTAGGFVWQYMRIKNAKARL